MTLAEIRNSIRVRLGVASNDAFYTNEVLTDIVNEGLYAMCMEADWPWLQVSTTFSTAAGTQAYTPPASWVRTKALTPDEGADSLVLLSLIEIREFGDEEEDRGFPRYYTVWDEDILIAPVPDEIYTIKHDYIRTEDQLDQDNDTPILPVQWHYALVHLCAGIAQLRQNETQRWEAEMKNYEKWLERMHDNRRRSSANLRVRVRPGSQLY